MDFSIEQIMESNNYNEVCKTFLSFAKDEVTLEKLKEILYYGKSNNYHFKSKFHCRDNPQIERLRRIDMASVFIRNPETFTFFEQNNINIFHGTNANSLPGILKYGMYSYESLIKEGIPVLTGEEWSRGRINRQFISFTDVLDVAEDYSFFSSKNGDENISFNVIIGVAENEMNKAKVTKIHSDVSEIGVMQHLPLKSISCICVPEDKVEFVKKMMINCQIPVLGMRDLNRKAYYIGEWEDVQILRELYESKHENSQKFSFNETKEFFKSRSFSKMEAFIEKLKTIFKKGVEDEHGRSFRQ